MEFRVLGSLEVLRDDEVVEIGSANERRILASLLVHPNAVVSTSRLIEVVWGDDPPASDRNALQTYVARLRRRLRTGSAPAPIVTRPPGYVIELAPDQLDSLRFRGLVHQAQATMAADPARALEVLDDALALWRGPAFAEFAEDDLARAEAAILEDLRQAAIEDRAEALLQLGRAAEAVSVLEGIVATHPLRERPHAQLMTALARCGRQVDALRAYQRFRERLADELGLEPSAALRELEVHVLVQAPQLTTAKEALPSPPHRQAAGNLVSAITTFVGREDDVVALSGLVARARVVTLVGVGGVGKSRLAARVAENVAASYRDGTWIVELARLAAPDAVPHAVAAALGVALPAADEDLVALVDALGARRMLLVVDNCEHVLDAAARVVDALARRCPNVTVVATSRERLGVGGEHVWPVLPLPVPPPTASDDEVDASPAVALFLDRARAARPDFGLGGANRDAVVEICRGLDGLPLALEIAAARLSVLSVHDLAQRLRDRFALLTAGPRGEGERHRTLRALVDWSYGLLDDDERATFDRLSVFAGGWTLEAAAAVCSDVAVGGASEVTALVASLAEKSMVVPPAPSGPSRYGMLETLRLYGAATLSARGDSERASEAHARYFVELAERADVGLRGPQERAWAERLRAELDNLRAANRWCREQHDPDLALRLSAALHRFARWQANDEILSWAEAVAELPAARDHPLFPVVLGVAATRRENRGELNDAIRYAERALACCAEDDARRALPTEALAGACLLSGQLNEALEHAGEAARLWELTGDDQARAWNLCTRAVAAAKLGDLQASLAATGEARAVAASAENPTTMAVILYAEGESLLEEDPVRALEPITEALEHALAANNVFMAGLARLSITSLRGRHGDPGAALRLFEDVLAHWRLGGSWAQQWLTLRNLVELLARAGASEPAAVLYGACTASTTAPTSYGAEADRLDAVVGTLVTCLGEAAFAEATARGATLAYEEAEALALATIRRLLSDIGER